MFNTIMGLLPFLFFCACFFCNNILLSSQATSDTLKQGESIVDDHTLVSAGASFELGFFSPGTPDWQRLIGIWYKNIPEKTVVWVANRGNPTPNGLLTINNEGNLVIRDKGGGAETILASGTGNTSLRLLDSGNLVFYDSDDSDKKPLWQSFDNPFDTFLPGMKLGLKHVITSRKSTEDTALGWFSLRPESGQNAENFSIWSNMNSNENFSSSSWPNFISGSSGKYDFAYGSDGNESYVSYSMKDSGVISRFVLELSGQIKEWTWSENDKRWQLGAYYPKDPCEAYAPCGAYSSCTSNKTLLCNCLQNFKPNFAGRWRTQDWSAGCSSSTKPQCGNNDGFFVAKKMKFSNPTLSSDNTGLVISDCEKLCLKNCNCTAFASAHVNGTGCWFWHRALISLQEGYDGGRDLHVRITIQGSKKWTRIILEVVVPLGILLLGSLTYCLWRRRLLCEGANYAGEEPIVNDELTEGGKNCAELPLFSLASIVAATDNFSAANKLGEGGFGSVYKGMLFDGQEVAMKRLSTSSKQGLVEFKNEIILVAKLQHTNLVRILGYCIEGKEKILIYEYLPNKSLDSFLFDADSSRRAQLNWGKRFSIIEGIAQGLLYIHTYSRLKIIHRDMKASNILLDSDMNPKIADFGMARIFGENASQENTERVVGTFGYMAPEYIMKGAFSVKSDVYAFGVLLLEIVTGKKNIDFHPSTSPVNLVGHVWQWWKDGKAVELIDPALSAPSPLWQLLQCIHVALLCVQDCAEDRPSMSTVIFMLSSEMTALPMPKQPTFFTGKNMDRGYFTPSNPRTRSINDLTFSTTEAR